METITVLNRIVDRLKSIKKETTNGSLYSNEPNFFYMLKIEEKEVLICRMLKAIIEPNGIHGLGIEPLNQFLKIIGHKTSLNLNNAYITLEEEISDKRRVDIVIHIDNEVLPIEAKIWAGDQPSQLFDYYHYYKDEGYQIDKIYYLTPYIMEGRPSNYSLTKKTNDGNILELENCNYECISFSETIVNLIDNIIKLNCNEKILFILNQFLEVLKDMTKEEKMQNTIISEVRSTVKNEDSIQSLFMLLKYSDAIRYEYEKDYFIKSLQNYPEYTIGPATNDSELSDIKRHERFKIFKNSVFYAFLCVDTNLYIVREFEEGKVPSGWKPYPDKKHAWKWVTNNKDTEKWNLSNIDIELYGKTINWSEYLD